MKYSFEMSMGRVFRGTRNDLLNVMNDVEVSAEQTWLNMGREDLLGDFDMMADEVWQQDLEQLSIHQNDWYELNELLTKIDM